MYIFVYIYIFSNVYTHIYMYMGRWAYAPHDFYLLLSLSNSQKSVLQSICTANLVMSWLVRNSREYGRNWHAQNDFYRRIFLRNFQKLSSIHNESSSELTCAGLQGIWAEWACTEWLLLICISHWFSKIISTYNKSGSELICERFQGIWAERACAEWLLPTSVNSISARLLSVA